MALTDHIFIHHLLAIVGVLCYYLFAGSAVPNNQKPLARLAGAAVFTTAWFMLSFLAILLGGSGVNSQAPLGLSEGITGSTQFTISLPVTRLRLFAIRAAVGLVETAAMTALTAFLI